MVKKATREPIQTGKYSTPMGDAMVLGGRNGTYTISWAGDEKDPRPRQIYRSEEWVRRAIKQGDFTKITY